MQQTVGGGSVTNTTTFVSQAPGFHSGTTSLDTASVTPGSAIVISKVSYGSRMLRFRWEYARAPVNPSETSDVSSGEISVFIVPFANGSAKAEGVKRDDRDEFFYVINPPTQEVFLCWRGVNGVGVQNFISIVSSGSTKTSGFTATTLETPLVIASPPTNNPPLKGHKVTTTSQPLTWCNSDTSVVLGMIGAS